MSQSANSMFSLKNLEYNSYKELKKIHNIYQKTNNEISLLGYKKNEITDDITEYRSLIFSNDKLLAYSPPKSIKYDIFKETYENFTENDIKISGKIKFSMLVGGK